MNGNGDPPIDDKIALKLQDRYHKGERHALGALYSECRYIAMILGKAICRKRNIRIQPERLREVAHDAASDLIGRFLKNPAYHVRNFRAMLYLDTLNRLMDGKRRGRPQKNKSLSLEKAKAVGAKEQTPVEDPAYYIQDILHEHKLGWWILCQLADGTNYRETIKAIARHVERRWLMDRAEKLRAIYKTLRTGYVQGS